MGAMCAAKAFDSEIGIRDYAFVGERLLPLFSFGPVDFASGLGISAVGFTLPRSRTASRSDSGM